MLIKLHDTFFLFYCECSEQFAKPTRRVHIVEAVEPQKYKLLCGPHVSIETSNKTKEGLLLGYWGPRNGTLAEFGCYDCTRAKNKEDCCSAHSTAVVDNPANCTIGKGTRIWHHAHVMEGATIGERCIIGQNVFVDRGAVVGNGVKLENNVSVYNSVTIEDDVFCGPSCVFTNVVNPRAFIERKHEFKPTLVKKGATIGANATIVCGVTIGEYAFVAAGAVVTKDVLPHSLVMGVPAKHVKYMNKEADGIISWHETAGHD